MEDGPHTEGMNEAAPPASKVVRLPREWLGPHEELVPFGRRRAPSEAVSTPPDPPRTPPSAEDFWGEHSAAIHHVVQAPVHARDQGSASPVEPVPATRRFGLGARRLGAASIASFAVVVALVLVFAGSPRHPSGGARLNLAAILSSGVSRISNIGPLRIISATGSFRPRIRQIRQVPHHPAPAKPPSHGTQQQSSAPAPPAPTYAARATSASDAPTYRSNVSASSSYAGTNPSPASPSPSSGASVSPTGESGALGPVQSPNG